MLGSSGLVGSPGDGGGGGAGGGGEVAVVSGGGGAVDIFEGDRSSGGNRWPRQETIALLKIRSDMDVVFRDSSLKGPLWEEVSRKMAELGYNRSAKKCKEKFENVYKYHKRTKDGRVGKSDGKTYRFCDQLEALEQHHSSALPPAPPRSQTQPQHQAAEADAVPVSMVMPAGHSGSVTVSSSPHPITVVHAPHIQPPQQVVHHAHVNPTTQIPQPPPPMQQVVHSSPIQVEQSTPSSPSGSATPSSSSSTSSDEELLGRRKRKRKWKDYFERMMKEVIDKQEEVQKRFLEAVEKRERDLLAREEAWKTQELARLNREHEILVQERSMAAARDAALVSFLQKLSEQQKIPLHLPVQPPPPVVTATTAIQPTPQPQPQQQQQPPVVTATTAIQPTSQPQPHQQTPVVAATTAIQRTPQPQPQPQPPVTQQAPPQPQSQPQPTPQKQVHVQVQENPVSVPQAQLPPQQATVVATSNNNVDIHHKTNGNGDNQNSSLPASSSRWPRAEVQALINLRTSMDQKYQENGPKGPLWEEISASMKKLGYSRNSKRCKEKWENINKYFKKVKESNKKRPDDAKTCPYFHQLDALYREKSKTEPATTYQLHPAAINPGSAPAQPEPQWLGQRAHRDEPDSDGSDGDDEDDDDEEPGSGYEIVANNAGGSMSTTTTTTA